MGKFLLRLSGPLLALAFAVPAFAVDTTVPVIATHIAGIPAFKTGVRGKLTIQNGVLRLTGKTATGEIEAASIDEIHTSTEVTQIGGNYGTVAKVAAKAAPYGTGSVLSLILWTKIDLLTVLYHGPDGDVHSVLLALPRGQAAPIRSQLLAAGAHTPERTE
jgi:hypothetical protein